MLDDFRDAGDFVEEEEKDAAYDEESFDGEESSEDESLAASDDLMFGMTPTQRFVLVVLFFLSMCLLGTFCLLVTEKIALPLY